MSKVTKRPNAIDNPPQASIDVPSRWIRMVQKLEPGVSVRVVLEGTVKSVDKQAVDSATFGFPGYLVMEMRQLRVQRANSFYDEVINDEDE